MLPGVTLSWEPPEKTPPVLLLEFILGCTGEVKQPLRVINTELGRYNLCIRHTYTDIHFMSISNLTSFSIKQHHPGQYFDEKPCWKEPRNSLTLAVLWGMARRTNRHSETLLDFGATIKGHISIIDLGDWILSFTTWIHIILCGSGQIKLW